MAARYWITGGITNNWSDTSNWSTTSGGGGGSAVPTAADDVTFDGAGNSNCTLNTSTAKLAKSLTVTAGYTQTLTFNVTLTVSGNVSLGVNMVFAGSSELIVAATATLTSNGKTLGVPFRLKNVASTFTLADNWTVPSITLEPSGSGTMTVNSNTLNITGSVTTLSTSARITGGTTLFNLTGTGTWSGTGTIINNLTINTAGTITISGTVNYGTNTLTYIAGTVTTTGSTLAVPAATGVTGPTLACSGITWNNYTVANTLITTLNEDFNATGVYTTSNATVNTSSGSKLNIGGWAMSATNGGTATIVFSGTGTWSSTVGVVTNAIEINTAGTLTISGSITVRTSSFTFTAGTMDSSSGTILFNTTSPTLTLNALMSFPGTLSFAVSPTFAGTHGFSVGTYTSTTAGLTHTFAATKTYTVTGALTLTGTNASRIVFVSSTGASQAIFTLQNNLTTTQDVGYVNATDIDSSLGQTIWDFGGTLSNATNWNLLTAQQTYANTFTQ